MFKQIKPHKRFVSACGEELTPVMTLKDERGKLLHIAREDDCYVPYLYAADLGFTPTYFLFPELHAALVTLPQLEQQ